MDIYNRTLICSSDLFQGFEVIIDIRYYQSINEIIEHFKNELISVLNKYKLEILCKKCESINFHIHTHTIDEILMTNDNIYICHC